MFACIPRFDYVPSHMSTMPTLVVVVVRRREIMGVYPAANYRFFNTVTIEAIWRLWSIA